MNEPEIDRRPSEPVAGDLETLLREGTEAAWARFRDENVRLGDPVVEAGAKACFVCGYAAALADRSTIAFRAASAMRKVADEVVDDLYSGCFEDDGSGG